MKRVVITGMGAVTPIGNNVEEFWNGLKTGKNGIGDITLFDVEETKVKVKIAAEVKNLNLDDYLDNKVQRKTDRFTHFAMIASKEAIKDSKLELDKIDSTRMGTIIGCGIGSLMTIEEEITKMLNKGVDRVSPMVIPKIITNMAAGNVAIDLGIKGVSLSTITACASGTHAIGESYRYIKYGEQDIMVAGGTEACISPMSIAGFTNIRALTRETDITRASIPFDKERSGFVMGEGAGILIMEELEHAKARGAKIYAEIVGYGATSDAYHITAPSPDADGAMRSIQNAIDMAGIEPKDVNYINAHGTSTEINDRVESLAIKNVFKEDSDKVLVSSIKGSIGHLLGAAGGVEAIASIKAIENSFVPATQNYKVPDEDCDLDYVPNVGREVNVNYALSNSLGFGGHNASVLFKKYEN